MEKFEVFKYGDRINLRWNDIDAHGNPMPRNWILTADDAQELRYRLNKRLEEIRREV